MADKIKDNHDDIEDAVKNMTAAINTYNSLAENGFDTAITTLDGMNSDYVDKLQNVLDCLNSKVKEKMSENILSYTEKAAEVDAMIKETDEKLANVDTKGE